MKAIIISDIHGDKKILNKILNANKDVDYRIFLGDFDVSKEEQKELTQLFDYVVKGNCDHYGFSNDNEYIEIDSLKIFLTHGHTFSSLHHKIDLNILYKEAKLNGVKLILHGHDHISAKENVRGIIRFNPGSTTLPRGGTKPSYGMLEIENGEIISLEHILCVK